MKAAAIAVNAAMGALVPVLAKLTALLEDEVDEHCVISIMISQLEPVDSLLQGIWEMVDFDALCKDETMAEVRELSYDINDAIDDFWYPRGDGGFNQRSTSSRSPFDELIKTKVEEVSKRLSEKCRRLLEQQQPSPTIDRRASFVHHMDESELVGMDNHREELIKLLEQGADTNKDASRWRIATPWLDERRIIVIKMPRRCKKCTSVVLQSMSKVGEVCSVNFDEINCTVEVVSEGMDIAMLMSPLRRFYPSEGLEEVSSEEEEEEVEEREMHAASNAIREFCEVKTVCILGLPGGGKTTLAKLLYHSLRERFQCIALASLHPSATTPNPNVTEILTEIFTGVGLTTSCGETGTPDRQYLIDKISTFLVNKKYLIVIDDIWRWEEWEIIRKSIPKNDLGSRIIMTTRLNSIAEKCRTDDNDAFVYEIVGLDNMDALQLSKKIVRNSLTQNSPETLEHEDNPCHDIVKMCSGMLLALICMSSALAKEREALGGNELQKWRALRHIEDGILHIPSLKPLAGSLSLGYLHLPIHLRTFLLYCSVYYWDDRIERGRLVMRWIAERFASGERTAEYYFDELVDREWIKHTRDGNYKIHPMMLAFLRCKSKEYNFVTCLGEGSDTASTSSRRIRRLSLQRGYPVDCFSSSNSMDVSHTRSLVVRGNMTGIPFNMFERLRVLDLEENEDIKDSHLQEICECEALRLSLRYLGLTGTQISKLPREIRKLKNLEILYVGFTQIEELPEEIGKLKHLETLDVRNTMISVLPPQIGKLHNLKTMCLRNTSGSKVPQKLGKLKHLETLDVRNTMIRELPWRFGLISESLRVLAGESDEEVRMPVGVRQALEEGNIRHASRVLSIAILDRFGPPLVGIFKVPGRYMHIPKLIKEKFQVLSCLDIRLCNKLEDDDQQFLAEMPNLRTLVLRFEALPRELLRIKGTGFQMLENLRIDSRVPRITFEEKAMPNLKHLEFKFYAGPASNDPIGITNLERLEKVVFRCSKRYNIDGKGISAAIGVIMEEARKHSNRIRLCINVEGKKEIFIELRNSGQNIADSSGTTRGVETEPERHHTLPADRVDYKKKGILHDSNYASCSRMSEIEEEPQESSSY